MHCHRKNRTAAFPLRSFPNRISKSAKTWAVGVVRLPNRMAFPFFSSKNSAETFRAEIDFCNAHTKVIISSPNSHLLLNILWEGLSQPAADACTTKKCRNWKKNYLKHPGNPRFCDFRICIRRTSRKDQAIPIRPHLRLPVFPTPAVGIVSMHAQPPNAPLELGNTSVTKNAPTTSNFKTFQRVPSLTKLKVHPWNLT